MTQSEKFTTIILLFLEKIELLKEDERTELLKIIKMINSPIFVIKD